MQPGFCPTCGATVDPAVGLMGNVNVVNGMIMSGNCEKCFTGPTISHQVANPQSESVPAGICPTCKAKLERDEGLTGNIEVTDGRVVSGYCKRCDPNIPGIVKEDKKEDKKEDSKIVAELAKKYDAELLDNEGNPLKD